MGFGLSGPMADMTHDERALKVFGREVRRLRTEAELTQEAVARRISRRGTTISNSHVSDIEKGKAVPRPWLRRTLDEILQKVVAAWNGSGRSSPGPADGLGYTRSPSAPTGRMPCTSTRPWSSRSTFKPRPTRVP